MMHHCHIDDRMKIGMVAFYNVEPYASVDLFLKVTQLSRKNMSMVVCSPRTSNLQGIVSTFHYDHRDNIQVTRQN